MANIFDFATKELTQDAFLCWSFQWINEENLQMKNYGLSLLNSFLAKHNIEIVSDVLEVEVKRQYKKIDVLIRVKYKDNKRVSIIIEDKTCSTEHSNQLKRYKEIILNEEKIEPVGIYYKTDYIYDYEEKVVDESGYKIFTKDDMIQVMLNHRDLVDSEIFHSYLDYLIKLQEKEDSIKELIRQNDIYNTLNTHIGQWILMKEIFYIDNDKVNNYPFKEELYHGSSFGRPWTQYKIIDEKEFIKDSIFYRIDNRSGKYYISLRQYNSFYNVSKEDFQAKMDKKMQRLAILRECFDNVIKNKGLNLNPGMVITGRYKESEIGIFFIGEENNYTALINNIKIFNKKYQEELIKYKDKF